jgi:hypothetical protein
MPKLLSREEFDKFPQLSTYGLQANSWNEVLGEGWEYKTDREIYDLYVLYYLTHYSKLGKLIAGVDE